jgi:four helix bundle protein
MVEEAASYELRAKSNLSMRNFKKLKIWAKGMQIVVKTYQLAKLLPADERFALRSQTCRSSISIPSNIAEGSAKKSSNEYIHYLGIALGSAYELETQVLAIQMIGYADGVVIDTLLKDVDEEQKMIQSFIKTVENP